MLQMVKKSKTVPYTLSQPPQALSVRRN